MWFLNINNDQPVIITKHKLTIINIINGNFLNQSATEQQTNLRIHQLIAKKKHV